MNECTTQLAAMRDATRATEQREDEYLRDVALRHAPPEKKPPPSPAPALVRALLQHISLGTLAAMAVGLVVLGCAFRWLANEHVEKELVYAAGGCIVAVGAANALGYGALAWRSRVGARCFTLVLLLLSTASVFALDQLAALRFTLGSLQMDMTKAAGMLSDADVEVLVNGGAAPLLLHRFTLDGPARFLRWLHAHCSSAAVAKLADRSLIADVGSSASEGDLTVDSPEFYKDFWRPRENKCVDDTLATFRAITSGVQIVLAALLVVMAVQLTLSWILFLLDDTESETAGDMAASRNRKKRRRGRSSARTARAKKDPRHTPFASVVTLLAFVITVSGMLMCGLSASLFLSCDFALTSVRWVLVAIFASGVVSVVTGVLVSCCRLERTAFIKWLLVVLAIADVYAVSQCMAAQEQLRSGESDSSGKRAAILRGMYELVADQTCALVSDWRAHTCEHRPTSRGVGTNATVAAGDEDSSEALDTVCQEELVLLLLATLKAGISWLGALEATIGFLLLILFAPAIRDAAAAVTRCVCVRLCCISRPRERDNVSSSSDGGSNTAWLTRKAMRLPNARDRYLATVRTKDEAALEVEAAQFDAEWATMTGRSAADISEATMVLQSEFDAIVRSLVIRRLTARCKMDVSLSISKDGTQLFAKIFASDNLLMATLCDMDYSLELADFVDPGPAFWQHDKREIKNDMKILDPHTIKHKLRLLASNDIIPKREAERFPSESLSRVSARIHALTRAARVATGSLKCQNPHLPYAHYVPHPEFQFLFKKHPNQLEVPGIQRRSSVLRTIDCLRITRHLIERELNVDQMVQSGLLTSFHCLHSASRFDFNSRAALLPSWILFWRPRHLPGEFDPETHWLLNQLGRLYPFRQPLRDVRDYFGECIAFYFAWLAFYTQSLVLPALVVVVMMLFNDEDPAFAALTGFFRIGKVESASFAISSVSLAFGVGVIVWGLLFAKFWERKSVWYQLEWGMASLLDADLRDRAGFWGEMRRHPVTNELETHFSSRRRLLRQICGAALLTLLAASNLLLVIVLVLAQGYVSQWGLSLRLAVLVSSCCQAIVIQWNGELISIVAHRLSEFENYQNEADFQASVIAKVFALQLINTFSGLVLLAFADVKWFERIPGFHSMARVYQRQIAPEVNALVQLETLLLVIFLVRISSHLLSIARNISLGMLAFAGEPQEQSKSGSKPNTKGADVAIGSNGMSSTTNGDAEDENALEEYRGSYEDYTQIVMQFGLVVMFSSVFPPAPLLAFVECVLEMRLDALDLCLFFRRPSPDAADSIGAWATCVRVLLKLSFATLFGLVYFTADNYAEMSVVQRMSAFLAATLGCWLLTEIVWLALPSTSSRAEEVRARNDFLLERYFGADGQTVFGDDGTDDGGSGGLGGTKKDRSASVLLDAIQSDAEDLPLDSSLEHYRERVELLRRLNVALRKRDDMAVTGSLDVEPLVEDTMQSATLSDEDTCTETADVVAPTVTDAVIAETTDIDHGVTDEQDTEEMIVGYFKPVRAVSQSFRAAGSGHAAAVAEAIEEAVPLGIPVAQDVRERSTSASTAVPDGLAEGDGRRRPSKRPSFFARLARRGSHRASSNASDSRLNSSDLPSSDGRSLEPTRQDPAAVAVTQGVVAANDGSGVSVFGISSTGGGAGPRQPPRLELSGIEAVREATRYNEFDFFDDDDDV